MDLGCGLGDSAPSHPSQTVASLPDPKDFLDAAPNTVDRLVPSRQAGLCFLFIAALHAGDDDTRGSTLGENRIAKDLSAISAVS